MSSSMKVSSKGPCTTSSNQTASAGFAAESAASKTKVKTPVVQRVAITSLVSLGVPLRLDNNRFATVKLCDESSTKYPSPPNRLLKVGQLLWLQDSAHDSFSKGESLWDTLAEVVRGQKEIYTSKQSPNGLPTIRVVELDRKFWVVDTRRPLIYKVAFHSEQLIPVFVAPPEHGVCIEAMMKKTSTKIGNKDSGSTVLLSMRLHDVVPRGVAQLSFIRDASALPEVESGSCGWSPAEVSQMQVKTAPAFAAAVEAAGLKVSVATAVKAKDKAKPKAKAEAKAKAKATAQVKAKAKIEAMEAVPKVQPLERISESSSDSSTGTGSSITGCTTSSDDDDDDNDLHPIQGMIIKQSITRAHAMMMTTFEEAAPKVAARQAAAPKVKAKAKAQVKAKAVAERAHHEEGKKSQPLEQISISSSGQSTGFGSRITGGHIDDDDDDDRIFNPVLGTVINYDVTRAYVNQLGRPATASHSTEQAQIRKAAVRQFKHAALEFQFATPPIQALHVASEHLQGVGSARSAALAYQELQRLSLHDHPMYKPFRIAICEAVALFVAAAATHGNKKSFDRELAVVLGELSDDMPASQFYKAYYSVMHGVPGAFMAKGRKNVPKQC